VKQVGDGGGKEKVQEFLFVKLHLVMQRAGMV
jgi:hypothetical protein